MEGQGKDSGSAQIGPLIMMLDKPTLVQILKHLSSKDLERLTRVCDGMFKSKMPSESDRVTAGKLFLASDTRGEGNHLKEALVMAIGADGTEHLLHKQKWLTIANRVKPKAFAAALCGERPALIAIALAQLPPKFAAEVLSSLPADVRAAAIDGLDKASKPAQSALDAILTVVEKSVATQSESETPEQGAGAKRAAQILNQLDADSAGAILEQIRARDAGRADAIQSQMFQFADFLKLDNRTLQQILASSKPEIIARALKGVAESEKAIIFEALPEQVRVVVEAEISDSGKLPKRQIEAARREILELAQQLDRDGKIRLRPDPDLV